MSTQLLEIGILGAIGPALGKIAGRMRLDVRREFETLCQRVGRQPGCAPLEVPAPIAHRALPPLLGLATIETRAFRTEKLEKIVLTRVRALPVVEGVAVSALPRLGVEAPAFAGDAMALPHRSSVFALLDGGGRPPGARFAEPFQAARARQEGLDPRPLPEFLDASAREAALSATVGAESAASSFCALRDSLEAYLAALSGAADGADPLRAAVQQARFANLWRTRLPARAPLTRLFGVRWTYRYLDFLFRA